MQWLVGQGAGMSLCSNVVGRAGVEGGPRRRDCAGHLPLLLMDGVSLQVLLQSVCVVSPHGFVYIHVLRPAWFHGKSLTY